MRYARFVVDDLTGAADVRAQAHRHGLDAVLIVGEGDGPLPMDADVVGIAGPSRSLSGAAFDTLVRAWLDRAATGGAEVLLYKVCSTFGGSPTRGSIGLGVELVVQGGAVAAAVVGEAVRERHALSAAVGPHRAERAADSEDDGL